MRKALTAVLGLVALFLLLILYGLFAPGQAPVSLPVVAYSDLIGDVDAGRVAAVSISGPVLEAEGDGRRYRVYLPGDDPAFIPRLLGKNVRIAVRPAADDGSVLVRLLLNWGPTLLVTAVWVGFLARLSRHVSALTRAVERLPETLGGREG